MNRVVIYISQEQRIVLATTTQAKSVQWLDSQESVYHSAFFYHFTHRPVTGQG